MGKRTVTVIGSGTVQVSPDVVRLDLRVGHDAADVAEALSGATHGITSVIEAVRAAGVADSDIRTLNASVNQRWDINGIPVGFTAQQQLGVVVRRPTPPVRSSRQVPRRSATPCSSTRFASTCTPATMLNARPETRRSRTRGRRQKRYAALAGCRLGETLGVAEFGATPVGAQRQKGFAASMSMAAAGMPVEGGDLDVSTSVTVTWELSISKRKHKHGHHKHEG